MSISIFDLFTIGIGPSSSHTVGPMRAAYGFVKHLQNNLTQVARIQIDLYGSLALTGQGHGTDKAILNGLEGHLPVTIDPDIIVPRAQEIIHQKRLCLAGQHEITFDFDKDFIFHFEEILEKHANGMLFTAFDQNEQQLLREEVYSIGGGFIVRSDEFNLPITNEKPVPYPFAKAKELLNHCQKNNMSISDIMMANECVWRSEKEVRKKLLNIAEIMKQCIDHGCQTNETTLPGILNVKRRAPTLFKKLCHLENPLPRDTLNWVNLYALAVNEENAAGKRVVTAPTNGAAGVIPAVLYYFVNFCQEASVQGIIDFLLTAGAIAILYKKGASISAAEVGCQGEVGVACSMAAAGLTAVLGGTVAQVENAAEIAMEHNLGLTCDPIAGLVQIPCIERNTMGAVQAINAAQLALIEEGMHMVSLDKVIATMLQTGRDMQSRYKETSQAGLAVNHPEC